MYLEILLWLLAFILVVAGMAGLLFPVLPGAPILYAGLLVAAWAEGFVYVGSGTLIVLGIMALLMANSKYNQTRKSLVANRVVRAVVNWSTSPL